MFLVIHQRWIEQSLKHVQDQLMGNIFNEDFRDFLTALNYNGVRYILVGGFSVILHGYSRTTGDMDIWVERTSINYKSLKAAFLEFGMPVFGISTAISMAFSNSAFQLSF